MSISLSSDDLLPFHGYRRRSGGEGFERGGGEIYSSIEHFFQSEKFRGVDEEFRQHIISLPTAREARKAALKREADIRPGWEKIQNKVMAAAIWFKFSEHERFAQALLADPHLAEGAYRFKDHYWGDLRDGVSIGFYRRILLAYREKLRSGVMRVLVTGSSDFSNPFLFQTKMKTLLKQTTPDEFIINCGRGADVLAERWAIAHAIPVRHCPLRGSRSHTERERRNREALSAATHAIVFVQGNSPRIDELLVAAKERQIPTRLIRLDAEGKLQRSPPGPRASSGGRR